LDLPLPQSRQSFFDETMHAINAGNVIEVKGRIVVVLRDAELADDVERRCDEYGPRVAL
jgi:hypothetical protein